MITKSAARKFKLLSLHWVTVVVYSIFVRSDDNCGLNEYCALFVGECRTSLPDGSICLLDKEADHIIINFNDERGAPSPPLKQRYLVFMTVIWPAALQECLNHCGSGGVCSECTEDTHCDGESYCAYKYLPTIENECSGYCNSLCLFSAQCQGECNTCTWGFTCQK